jgi:hypothetical protein
LPTKRIFQLALIVSVGTYVGMGGAKLWARRYLAEGSTGALRPVAEFVTVI